jgi:hypothetical protein
MSEVEMGKGVSNEPSSDQQKLAQALETITEVLVSKKLEAVRGSVTALDTRVSDRFDALQKDSAEALERLKKDLLSRIDEVQGKLDAAEGRQRDAHGELDERTREAHEELKRDLQKAQSKAESKIRAAESEMEKNLINKEEALKKELGTLSAGLSAIQLELQDQAQATRNISKVLQNVATVFSGQPAAQAAFATPSGPGLGAADEAQVDNVLDEMFPPDDPALDTDQPDRDLPESPDTRKKR